MTFIKSLEDISKIAKENKMVPVREIFHVLAGRGAPALLILFSLPFCFPIQIPGFSTPFGFILGFLGIRIAFAKHWLWPEWILRKEITGAHVDMLVQKTIKVVLYCQKILKPRLLPLVQNPILHRIHGITIFLCSMLLALPLLIPLTNMFPALPILFFGFALLEDDGLVLILAYLLALICFSIFAALFYFGMEEAIKYFAN